MKGKKKKATKDDGKRIYHLTCKTCRNKIISIYPDDDQCGTCYIKEKNTKKKTKDKKKYQNK
ncbi:hypothetical protein [Nitrosopumilus sp.]|uniref:hypothetical protein n=1 Tax=Nitrosopumilus sp. TaxID=2024843 RepID=UPI00292D5FB9|nr:hypothetical protein [Nitrosopumilus sp.]